MEQEPLSRLLAAAGVGSKQPPDMPLSQLACHVQGHMTTALADPMDLNPTLSRYRLDTSWPTSLTNAQERVMVVDSDLLAGLEDRAAGEHIALLTSQFFSVSW
jgi:hypothetical protein